MSSPPLEQPSKTAEQLLLNSSSGFNDTGILDLTKVIFKSVPSRIAQPLAMGAGGFWELYSIPPTSVLDDCSLGCIELLVPARVDLLNQWTC